MTDQTKPFLVVYIVWHPGFDYGATIAQELRNHFCRKLTENIAGGIGLSVIYRSTTLPDSASPRQISLDEAETTAIIVLADLTLATDNAWTEYIRELIGQTQVVGLGAQVFTVSMEPGVVDKLELDGQIIRWDLRTEILYKRLQWLIGKLSYQFCRMLRHYLEHLRRPTEEEEALGAYLEKVQIFLSHSKKDDNGALIASAVRDRLHNSYSLSSFFDVYDIPPGLRFNKVILLQVRVSAMIVFHTDSYSAREWCRREIIEAKRNNVPLVVANCLDKLDERCFPYMGNVPVIRLDSCEIDRIDFMIIHLLDEVLKDFLWRCRIEVARPMADHAVVFMSRSPELISLANLSAEIDEPVIVYPDPPLSAEECDLFANIAPRVQLCSLTEWLAEVGQ